MKKNLTKTVGPPNNLTFEGLKRLIEQLKIKNMEHLLKNHENFAVRLLSSDEGKPPFRQSSFDTSNEDEELEEKEKKNVRSFTLVGQRVLVDHWFSYCDCKDKKEWINVHNTQRRIIKQKKEELEKERGPMNRRRKKEEMRIAEEKLKRIKEHCLLHVKIPAVFDAVDTNQSNGINFSEFLQFFNPKPHVYGQEFHLDANESQEEASTEPTSPTSPTSPASTQTLSPTSQLFETKVQSKESELNRLLRTQREKEIRREHVERNVVTIDNNVTGKIREVSTESFDLACFVVDENIMKHPQKAVFPDGGGKERQTFRADAAAGRVYYIMEETLKFFYRYAQEHASTEFYCVMNYRIPTRGYYNATTNPRLAEIGHTPRNRSLNSLNERKREDHTKYTTHLLARSWCPDRFEFRKDVVRQNLEQLVQACKNTGIIIPYVVSEQKDIERYIKNGSINISKPPWEME